MTAIVPVLINRRSAAMVASAGQIACDMDAMFAACGRRIETIVLEPEEIVHALRDRADAPLIVVGGGDATVRSAAGALVGRRNALAILPLGAVNRFARGAGIPLDLMAAVGSAVAGQRRRIDVAQVGRQVFLHDAAFGAGVRMRHDRDELPHGGWSRIVQAWQALCLARPHAMPLSIDTRPCMVRASSLMVSLMHGEASMTADVMASPRDAALTVATETSNRLGEAMRALFMREPRGRSGPRVTIRERATEIIIDGMGMIDARLDGEVTRLPLPLRVRIVPSALGIVTPREIAPPEPLLLAGARWPS